MEEAKKEVDRAILHLICKSIKKYGPNSADKIFDEIVGTVSDSIGDLKQIFEPYSNSWNFWSDKQYALNLLKRDY